MFVSIDILRLNKACEQTVQGGCRKTCLESCSES